MNYWQYQLIWRAALPLVKRRLKKRAQLNPGYGQNVSERYGTYPQSYHSNKPVVWLHCVSVGESIAAQPLIEWLIGLDRFQLLLTCSTPTGRDQLQSTFGDRAWLVFAPYDLEKFVTSFLDTFNPKILLVMETELWPSILKHCKKRGITSFLVNGRLSEKSAKGYAKLGGLSRTMLADIDKLLVQYETDKIHFLQLADVESKINVLGSIKFDITISETLRNCALQLKNQLREAGKDFIWIAASTHLGEDEIVLQVHQELLKQNPNGLLILVPRHPERFESVAQLCSPFKFVKRSLWIANSELNFKDVQVILGDTLGELMLLYGLADVAFVGGSLVENGGHNLVEPANWSLPLLSGPSLFNFSVISSQLNQVTALEIVHDSGQLLKALMELQSDDLRAEKGGAALTFAKKNRGALDRVKDALLPFLSKI
ncbi:lipid IV(A) 3-deoxy-D-manno-octulosonic acid transferase [Sessilibacter sp. MAH4]